MSSAGSDSWSPALVLCATSNRRGARPRRAPISATLPGVRPFVDESRDHSACGRLGPAGGRHGLQPGRRGITVAGRRRQRRATALACQRWQPSDETSRSDRRRARARGQFPDAAASQVCGWPGSVSRSSAAARHAAHPGDAASRGRTCAKRHSWHSFVGAQVGVARSMLCSARREATSSIARLEVACDHRTPAAPPGRSLERSAIITQDRTSAGKATLVRTGTAP